MTTSHITPASNNYLEYNSSSNGIVGLLLQSGTSIFTGQMMLTSMPLPMQKIKQHMVWNSCWSISVIILQYWHNAILIFKVIASESMTWVLDKFWGFVWTALLNMVYNVGLCARHKRLAYCTSSFMWKTANVRRNKDNIIPCGTIESKHSHSYYKPVGRILDSVCSC